MYCSTCGSLIPFGRAACGTCGGAANSIGSRPAPNQMAEIPDGSSPTVRLALGTTCPRCDYHGRALPYFSRGSHIVGLVALTLFTLPWALGSGGAIYYWLRRNHRICPRCGSSWGRHLSPDVVLPVKSYRSATEHWNGIPPVTTHSLSGERMMRVWSILLLILGLSLLAVGTVELELLAIVLGVLAGGGAFALHRGANAAREKRREALLSSLQLHVLKLAGERRGRLTVTEVAASLSWPIRRAERVLHSLDDGWRVNSEVTNEGVIVYEFRELLKG